jgi:hypothetical protein
MLVNHLFYLNFLVKILWKVFSISNFRDLQAPKVPQDHLEKLDQLVLPATLVNLALPVKLVKSDQLVNLVYKVSEEFLGHVVNPVILVSLECPGWLVLKELRDTWEMMEAREIPVNQESLAEKG